MKLSVSAYRAQAAAHKKILSNTNYQSGYSAGLSNPSASLASSILHAVPPTSPTTTQVDDDNECTISVTKSSLTSNNTMNSRNADQTNSDDQSVSLYCAKEDLNDKQAQKNKTNPRWIKLRTTVQISSAIQKKPSLKREDSFLKRFSTRPPAVTQETIEDTCSDGPTSEEGIKSWFYHPYQKKRKRKRLQNYHPISVVNPDQDFYFYWLFILTICVLYNLWTLIVRQSFPELQKLIENTWLACDTISDIVFVLDIVVQLRTGYLEQGLMVYNSRKLACHYLQSKSFIFDICALCPLDLLQIRFGTQPLLRFPRFLKVYRAVNYYYIVESRTVWPNLWRVANLIHILLILAHWFGCFYFLLSEVERFQGDWVYPYRPGDYSTLARKYLGSFYWATLTLTTIGDLPTPETNSEYLFTIVSYLIGVFIFATIVGQVGNVITNRNANRLEFERLLDGAKTYMRHHKVPSGMKRRVLRWYDYSWSRGRIQGGGDINTALGLLPDKLKTELALHVNLSVLKKVTIFQECQPEFLHDLVLKMKAYIFTPGDTICRKGEVAREMFIIADGILEVLNENGKVLTTMKAGDFFGEIGILNLDGLNKRTADVRSVGYSELFSLSREDVLSAMKDYPEAQEILQALGRKRLMEVKNSANKKRVLNLGNKGVPLSAKDGIVDKIKNEAKQSIRSVLKKTRTITHDNSIEMPPIPSSTESSFRNRTKGRLRRMSRVKSDETNPDDEHVIEVATMSPSSSSSSKNITPIGAGLPLLTRLKLLKEKQEQDEKSRNPTILPPLSVLKETSVEDRLSQPERNMTKVNFVTNLIPFSTSSSTDGTATVECQSSWTTLKSATFKEPVIRIIKNMTCDVVRKDYKSVKDLSPELFELPFVKKLKILNERQQLNYLRSLSLDSPKQRQEIKRASSDNCLLNQQLMESTENGRFLLDKNENYEDQKGDIDTNTILYMLRDLINSGFDDIYRKIETKFDRLYEAIECRDMMMNDLKMRLEELEKYSRNSSLETVIERAPKYECIPETSEHKQNCPVCTSQTVLEIDERTPNWELEMLAEQLSQKQTTTTTFDKRSVSLEFLNSEDTEENDVSFEGDDECYRLLRHKKYKRRKTVPRTSSNESDV